MLCCNSTLANAGCQLGRALVVCALLLLFASCAPNARPGPAPTLAPHLPKVTPATESPSPSPSPVAAAAEAVPTAPARTPTPTLVPTPSPTLLSLALVVLPAGTGDGPPDLAGEIRSADGLFEVDTHASGRPLYRFADTVLLEVDVTSIPADTRLVEVEFHFMSLDNLTDFNARTERTPLYCAFGGGEPDCNPLVLEAGARWPDSGDVVTNGVYCFSGRALLDSGSTRTWRLLVEIANPDLPPDATGGVPPVSGTVPPASPCLR